MLDLLARIEQTWLNALSLVANDDPDGAARETEKADALLAELQQEPVHPSQAAEVKERMAALGRLHEQLLLQANQGKARVEQELAKARQGARTLRAYGSGRQPKRMDRVL